MVLDGVEGEDGEDPTVLGGDGVAGSGEVRAPVLGVRITKLEEGLHLYRSKTNDLSSPICERYPFGNA